MVLACLETTTRLCIKKAGDISRVVCMARLHNNAKIKCANNLACPKMWASLNWSHRSIFALFYGTSCANAYIPEYIVDVLFFESFSMQPDFLLDTLLYSVLLFFFSFSRLSNQYFPGPNELWWQVHISRTRMRRAHKLRLRRRLCLWWSQLSVWPWEGW